jgi:hypothetical protein
MGPRHELTCPVTPVVSGIPLVALARRATASRRASLGPLVRRGRLRQCLSVVAPSRNACLL